MTALPNPFLNSTVIPEPPAVASTADSAYRLQNVARPDATAERDPHLISVSDGALCSSPPKREMEPSVTAALAPSETEGAVSVGAASSDKFDEPSMTNGGDQGTPASAPTKNPDAGVLADRIDWHAFFEAVMDERIVLFELYDEVPLFIREGEHLRRWEA